MSEFQPWEKEPPKKKRRRRSSHGGVWCVVILVLAAAIWFGIGTQPKRQSADGGARKDNCSTILIAGTDEEGYRTDTIMLLSVDGGSRSVSLMSIPRDTYVEAPYSVPKINSACGYAGGGRDGMEELMTQVSNVIGFMPDGYALVDLNAFVQIVDLMGGVDFDVPMDMQYSDPTQDLYIDLKAGQQHLDGDQAIQLVRFRSGYPMADITRTEVQRDFVKAAFSQWASVKSVLKLPGLIGIMNGKVTTDLSVRNICWIGRMLLSCGVSNMQTDTLPGTPQYIGGGSYYVADAEAVKNLMVSYSPYK